jgi:putative chitinase
MTNPGIPHLTSEQQRERAESLLVAAYRSGLTDPKELANFMGQVQHESQNFTRLEENLNYSGSRLFDVFPGRNGLTRAGAQAITDIPDRGDRQSAVAEQVYGGAWGARALGNTEAGDGYTYRGRGYVQLTGRGNYEAYGQSTGLDLLNHPELASTESNAERLAVQYWRTAVQPTTSARTDVTQAGSIINTGAVGGAVKGLAEREASAAAWETALNGGYLQEALGRHPVAQVATPSPTSADVAEDIARSANLWPAALRLIQDSEQQVRALAERRHLPWDQGMDNTVLAVAEAARKQGLSGITHLTAADGQIRFAQADGGPIKEGQLDARVAANTDAQESFGRLAQTDPAPKPESAAKPLESARVPEQAVMSR